MGVSLVAAEVRLVAGSRQARRPYTELNNSLFISKHDDTVYVLRLAPSARADD